MSNFVIPTIFSAVDRLTAPLRNMQRQFTSFGRAAQDAGARAERALRGISQRMDGIANKAQSIGRKGIMVAGAIAVPFIAAGNAAVKFEDRMADVSKTSGLAGKDLSGLGQDILSLAEKTRTPIEGLQKIAEIGGQLGITGRKNILNFTESVNQFSVALGSDFEGGVEDATRAIGRLNSLFKETRDLDIAKSITLAGSAINALSAKGVQVPELTEFTNRIGALPDAIKPTIQETIALGAVFNKAGITAEIAARGLGDVLITASQNAPAFAKQMKISGGALAELLNNDPTEFLKRFATSLKGLNAVQFAKLSKDLKLADSGSIKIIGSLSSSVDRLSEFQAISNSEFAKGTSLLNEYNTKNNTTAGKIQQSKNNFEALGITIGTELLPALNDLLKQISPVVKQFAQWTKENPETVKQALKVAGAIAVVGAGLFIASGFITAFSTALKLAEAAVWLFNIALDANPIGLVILALAGLTYWLVTSKDETKSASAVWGGLAASWKDFGKAIWDFAITPIMILIDSLKVFLKLMTGDFSGAWKSMGDIVNDATAGWKDIIAGTSNFKNGFDIAGMQFEQNKIGSRLVSPDFLSGGGFNALNPGLMKMQQQEINKTTTSNQNVSIDISAKNANAKVRSNTGGVPVVLTNTLGQYGN